MFEENIILKLKEKENIYIEEINILKKEIDLFKNNLENKNNLLKNLKYNEILKKYYLEKEEEILNLEKEIYLLFINKINKFKKYFIDLKKEINWLKINIFIKEKINLKNKEVFEKLEKEGIFIIEKENLNEFLKINLILNEKDYLSFNLIDFLYEYFRL